MRQHVVHLICITLAAGAVFFTNLGAAHLWDEDETLHATCAREMYERGDWVVPTYNGNLFPDKPPLMYWLMIGGYGLFGVTEFAARFGAAVLGVAAATPPGRFSPASRSPTAACARCSFLATSVTRLPPRQGSTPRRATPLC
ncbi:MAG: hypothetical protein RBS80_18890 [Thermoguttaceae bacterium]|nr:hypothetical protein [Thermoguttaceae bacterium]